MPVPELMLRLHVGSTLCLCGLIWVVQALIYPSFACVDEPAFRSLHDRHVDRIRWIVGPLMLVEASSGALLVWPGNPAVSSPLAVLGFCLIVLHLACTALVQVPLHRALQRRWDAATIGRLVRSNWIRTALWTTRGVLVLLWT